MNTEFTNMVMVTDPDTGKCVVIQRTKSWCGPAFPGGHLEKGEAFYSSAVREVFEETGLLVSNLESCGVIHWINTDTDDRYVVFCYRTETFEGTLKSDCDEGKLTWLTLDELEKMKAENDFSLYLPLFKGNYCEAVGLYNKDGNQSFNYI